MATRAKQFREHLSLFPKKYQAVLLEKLAYKALLEEDASLRIPPRIWLAFLTPPDTSVLAGLPTQLTKVRQLKEHMLETFAHPKLFLSTRDPHHTSSDAITLALLEILFDLTERKVLLSEKEYAEWIKVADHFGLWKLRYLLEDSVFEAFEPEQFSLFKSVVDRQMTEDADLVDSVRGIVGDALTRAGLSKFTLENRRKNIAGVYKKVAQKSKSINDIFDIHGFRVLVEANEECYLAVDVLHRLWPPFPERFKDYIRTPKRNGYQSIHTVLLCLRKKPVEFQVRTYEMDAVASSGPANHGEYKRAASASLRKIS